MPYGKAGLSRSFGAPGRYIQGPNEWERLQSYTSVFGKCTFALIDPFFYEKLSRQLPLQFCDENQITCVAFCGECCDAEIERLCCMEEAKTADVLVGIGIGRTVDTMKAVAAQLSKPLIVCPTAISTDAPTSASSIIYHQDHTYYKQLHKKNPDYVIVDTEVVVRAPLRLFVSGMGDALATYVEARACKEADNINEIGDGHRYTLAGMAIAKLSYELLLEKGRYAYLAAKNQVRSELFEDFAEVNTLLSGVGFENTGPGVAHGLQAALSTLPETHGMMHGELVAFGVLCQLVLENRLEEFIKAYHFCKDVGLPVCLDDIGLKDHQEEKLKCCIEYGVQNKKIIHVEPFAVTPDRLFHACMFVHSYAAENKS